MSVEVSSLCGLWAREGQRGQDRRIMGKLDYERRMRGKKNKTEGGKSRWKSTKAIVSHVCIHPGLYRASRLL